MSDYQQLRETAVTPGRPESPPSPSDAESGSTQKKPHPIHIPFDGIRIKGTHNFTRCGVVISVLLFSISIFLISAHVSFLFVTDYCICLPEPGYHLKVHGDSYKAKCQYINTTTGEVDHEYRYAGNEWRSDWEYKYPPIDKQCRKEKSLRLMYILTFPTIICIFIFVVNFSGSCYTYRYNNICDASPEEEETKQVEILWPFLIAFLFIIAGLTFSPIIVVMVPFVFMGWIFYGFIKWMKESCSFDICNICCGSLHKVIEVENEF